MRTRFLTLTAAAAAASVLAVGSAAAAGAEPHILGEADYPTAFEFSFTHDQAVIAQQSGIPAALDAANIMLPIPGWVRIIDASANSLNFAVDKAAGYPQGCARFTVSVAPGGGDWYAQGHAYESCPR